MEWKLDRVKNISEDVAKILLEGFDSVKEIETSNLELGKILEKIGLIKPKEGKPSFTEKDYRDKWGSYIGILTSNGLGYTEGAKEKLILHISPIAIQLKNNDISYEEFIIAILSRIQFPKPNGSASGYEINGEYDKPFIKILKVLYILYQHDYKEAWFDNYEIIKHMEMIGYNCNYIKLVQNILEDRKKEIDRSKLDSRDIFLNKCLESKIIIKNDNKFFLNIKKINDVKQIILKNEGEFFNEDKSKWNEFFGRSIV